MIPDSVTRIYDSAFNNCFSLDKISVPAHLENSLKFAHYTSEAQYTYQYYVLTDIDASFLAQSAYSWKDYLFDYRYNEFITLYIQTDNPDPNSFSLHSNADMTQEYKWPKGIDYKADEYVNYMVAVDGGYLTNLKLESVGDYDFWIVENTDDPDVTAITSIKTIPIASYEDEELAWIDQLIAEHTTDNMTSFEKMEAISNYLKQTFRYPLYTGNYNFCITATDRNMPYFRSNRWDSLVSPTILCKIAERIGGFTKIDNLYYSYADYGYSWDTAHYLCMCEVDGEQRFYEACPYSDSGFINAEEIGIVDLTDPSNLYPIVGMKDSGIKVGTGTIEIRGVETTPPAETTPTEETTTAETTTTSKETATTETTTATRETTTTETTSTTAKETTTTEATTTTAEETTTTEVMTNYGTIEEYCAWALTDYKHKTGEKPASTSYSENADGTVEIVLYDKTGEILDIYTIDPITGIGTASDGSEVNLPQTGIVSPTTALVGIGAMSMTIVGVLLIGISRKRRDEE